MSYSTEGREDSESCRICRGGGSGEEPLFHPCKCSGSIMYVHQDCLMEWLAHSHKKHCELCKTPFCFTKLYHPKMPSHLPVTVFFRKAASHMLSALIWWARGFLVTTTWLLWLPWTMRFVWWGLFWLADFEWSGDGYVLDLTNTNSSGWSQDATSTTDDMPAVAPWQPPTLFRILVWLFRMMLRDGSMLDPDFALFKPANASKVVPSVRHTLLSNISHLQSMTSNARLNHIVVDVLEGQIITFALVATIILILLIREWVVQQQPLINMADEEDIAHETQQPRQQHETGERPLANHDEESVLGRSSMNLEATNNSAEQRAQSDPQISDLLEGRFPTSDSQQDELPSPNSREVDASVPDVSREDTQADTSLAEPRAVKELVVNILEAMNLKAGHDPSDIMDDPSIRHLILSAHETILSLQHRARKAFLHEDGETIQLLRESLELFRKALASLPSEYSTKLEKARAELDQWLQSVANMPMLTARREFQDSSDHHAIITESQSEECQIRPGMPTREASSLAVELQRLLADRGSDERPIDPVAAESASISDLRLSDGVTAALSELSRDDTDSAPGHFAQSGAFTREESPENARLHSGFSSMSSVAADTQPSMRDHYSADEIGSSNHRHERMHDEEDLAPTSRHSTNREPETNARNLFDTRGLYIAVTGWLWGDIDPLAEHSLAPDNEERVVLDIANEAPFVPILNNPNDQPALDPEAVRAVAEAGIDAQDAEAVEDAEDLEGIMELIGMQGPITGLFTNALFAAVFVSCAMVLAVWVPYLVGKVTLVGVAHPVWVFRLLLGFTARAINKTIDCVVLCTAALLKWLLGASRKMSSTRAGAPSWKSMVPMLDSNTSITQILTHSPRLRADDVRKAIGSSEIVSVQAGHSPHTSLRCLQALVMCGASQLAVAVGNFDVTEITGSIWRSHAIEVRETYKVLTTGFFKTVWGQSLETRIPSGDQVINLFVSTLRDGQVRMSSPVQACRNCVAARHGIPRDVHDWTAMDQTITVILGYVLFGMLLAFYFYKVAPICGSKESKKIEDIVLEALQQAGGIAKVVLIISIEMLAFPLYCGILLDIAMLPISPGATCRARLQFTLDSPWTAVFVHWFVGTCYMFHFALFISMCRKILRKGVLHFIRDPDDPTFHPVRDVLERSVVSQLRRIASSALLYGGLLLVCLGSILWLLAYAVSGLIPVRWTSGDGVLSFPLDLLLHMSLKPLMIRYLMPNEWLEDIYQWWFRKCAHLLRLSDYFFGEKDDDQRGMRRYLVPGNDQVRVGRRNSPKSWIEVDDEPPDSGTEQKNKPAAPSLAYPDYTTISVPPWFQTRIGIFGVCLWAITAATGLSLTVLPLFFGRILLGILLPKALWISDIYAFMAGLCLLSATIHSGLHYRQVFARIASVNCRIRRMPSQYSGLVGSAASSGITRCLRCFYVYGYLTVVLPWLFALLIEFYLLSPLHLAFSRSPGPYTVHLLRSWTLGLQYLRVLVTAIRWGAESRPARAFEAVVDRGYSNPRPALATRYFFLPISILALFALVAPVSVGRAVGQLICQSDDIIGKQLAMRLAYPAALLFGVLVAVGRFFVQAVRKWRMRIRDEVYLIGERLHNFGEKRARLSPFTGHA